MNMQSDLEKLLLTVGGVPHAVADGFSVVSLPHFAKHYIGRDARGFPCILLHSVDAVIRGPIQLSLVEARFSMPCRVWCADADQKTEILSVVICTSENEQIQRYFLYVCETILRIVGPTPRTEAIATAVQQLVDLLQRLSLAPRKSAMGLFGELYFIHRSKNPRTSVAAWRSQIDEHFDFSIDDLRVEVKTSGNRARAHNFSFEQCNPPPGTIGVLISIFCETTGGGLSLNQLIERINYQLASEPDLLLRLQQIVLGTLGSSSLLSLDMCFDEQLAASSMLLYDLNLIPAIRGNIGTELSNIRFKVDLSNAPHADLDDLRRRSLRCEDLLPIALGG